MLNKEERENVLDILKNYKKLSEDKVCHEQLLKVRFKKKNLMNY